MDCELGRICVEAACMLNLPLQIEERRDAQRLYPDAHTLFFGEQFLSRERFSRLIERMEERKPYRIIDRANANWVLLSAGEGVLRIGPFSPELLTRNETGMVFRSFAGKGASHDRYYEGENEDQRLFRIYCMKMPLVGMERVERLIRFICKALAREEPMPMETIAMLNVDPLEEMREDPSKYIGYIEDCEAVLTACVAHHGTEKAVEIVKRLYDSAPSLSAHTTPWIEGFYRFCMIGTYARTGARRAGVPPVATERVAGLYLKRALAAETPQQLGEMAAEMTRALCELVRTCSNHSYSPMISSVMDYIAAHFTQNISPSRIAAEFGVNASYLSARFRRETGATLSAHINNARLEYARTLLTVSDMDIGSICADVGILDSSYFARLFRARYGFSPTAYRLSLLGRMQSIDENGDGQPGN